ARGIGLDIARVGFGSFVESAGEQYRWRRAKRLRNRRHHQDNRKAVHKRGPLHLSARALPCNLRPLFDRCRPTFRYLAQTEAHVYALAVSASVLLSFFPFCNVMLSFCRNVLHWRAAEEAIYLALNDYFPGEMAAFVKRNL